MTGSVTGGGQRGQRGLQVSVAEVCVAALNRPPGLSFRRVLSITVFNQSITQSDIINRPALNL